MSPESTESTFHPHDPLLCDCFSAVEKMSHFVYKTPLSQQYVVFSMRSVSPLVFAFYSRGDQMTIRIRETTAPEAFLKSWSSKSSPIAERKRNGLRLMHELTAI